MYAVTSKRIKTIIYGLGAPFIMVVVLSLFVSPVSAWPTEEQWNPLYFTNQTSQQKTIIYDGTTGSSSNNIVGDENNGSAWLFNDGSAIFFRLRVSSDPTAGGGILTPSGSWGVEWDTDNNLNTYEWQIIVNGQPDTISLNENQAQGTLGDPSDPAEIPWYEYPIIAQGNVNYTDTGSSIDSGGGSKNDWLIAWTMNLSDFQNATGLDNETASCLVFATGTGAGNTLPTDILSPIETGEATSNISWSCSDKITLRGSTVTNGTINFTDSNYINIENATLSDTIYVFLNDSDRNGNSLLNETATVVLNSSVGDSINLTLIETNNNTGNFTATFQIGVGPLNLTDNILQVLEKFMIYVTYNDTRTDGYRYNITDSLTVLDTTPPTISYNPTTTENNSELNSTNSITINFTASDLYLKNISVNLYNSTGSLLDSSVFPCSPCTTHTNYVNYPLSNGVYLFNVTAYDTSGNSNTTPTRTVTVNLTSGSDLQLTTQNITFVYDSGENAEVTEAGEARENINLTIDATVYNQGSSASGTFYVLFYDGSSEFYNVSMNSIAGSSSANATAYWTTLAGTHNITIKVDPATDTSDTDFSNNNASKLINVSAWQKYYGNATGNRMLANSLATSMNNWTWDDETNIGYLYVVNTSANINWSALHPLGYDSDNNANTTGQDFQNADTNLGMVVGTGNATGFQNNNITDLFTNTSGSNYGNIAIDKTSFVIFGNTIDNVPIVNATDMTNHNAVGSANFVTGVLWDDTKDSNGYYDTTENEDLVFITKIRQAATGLNGLAHNYEIAVPHTLNSITEGNVDMYMELI